MSTNFHTLPKAVRADRRKQAFKLLDTGRDKLYVSIFSEVHIKTVEDWLRKREELENNNYHGQKRGNPHDQKYLNTKQEEEIVEAIKTTIPSDHGVQYFLWSPKEFLNTLNAGGCRHKDQLNKRLNRTQRRLKHG